MTASPRTAQFFPFDRLGLRRNPFGSLTSDEWLAVTVIPPVIHDLLTQDCHSIQFTGEAGRGKTTLLLALRQHFLLQSENIPFEKLPEGQRHFTTSLARIDGFALDEAQRMGWLERRRLFRQMADRRLFITTHEDLSGWFRRYGRSPVTISAAECVTRDHLEKLLERRLAYFAQGASAQVTFSDEAIDYFWCKHGTDVRGMEAELYEYFQQLREPGIVSDVALKRAAD